MFLYCHQTSYYHQGEEKVLSNNIRLQFTGRAVAMNKPILCLYRPQEGKLLSGMIRGE